MSATQVLTDKAYGKVFETAISNNATIYKEIDYIQSRTRCKRGVTYDILFQAPLNDHDPESAKEEINYDYKLMTDDLQLLRE
jgi:hypothetical protein